VRSVREEAPVKRCDEVRFVIEMTATNPELFQEVAQACADVSRDEPGTLVYDWFYDAETGRARLYEAYESVGRRRGPCPRSRL
jgi:quinol monooxygenase YgiN